MADNQVEVQPAEEEVVKISSDQDLRKFLCGIFEQIRRNGDINLTPEMEASLRKALEDEDLLCLVPDLVHLVYSMFVMREVSTYEFLPNSSDSFSINFIANTLEPYKPINERQFDGHTLKHQTSKLKEVITDRLVFI